VPKAAANSSHQMLGERSWAVLASAIAVRVVSAKFPF
jgi:hypothetical protein